MLKGKNDKTLFVNAEFKTKFKLDDEFVSEYLSALNMDPESSYIPGSIFANYNLWNETIGKPPQGTVHLKQKTEYFLNPERGEVYDVKVTIKEIYQKRNRDYLVFETEVAKNGVLYYRSLTTYLWGFADNNGEENR